MVFKKGAGAKAAEESRLALLELDDMVLFPGTQLTLFVMDAPGIRAVTRALKEGRLLFVQCKTAPAGSAGRITQQIRLPDGAFRIVVEGQYRAKPAALRTEADGAVTVGLMPIAGAENTGAESPDEQPTEGGTAYLTALARNVRKLFVQYAEITKKVTAETLVIVEKTASPERLCDVVCHALNITIELKIELVSIEETVPRLTRLSEVIETENEILGLQKRISGDVKKRIDRRNREYVLREQLKEIHRELGSETAEEDECGRLLTAITEKNAPAEIVERAVKEIERLKKLQPFSPEAGVLRTYLEWFADLPWNTESADSADLSGAARILEAGHYGMKGPKDRILEFIAVHALAEPAAASEAGPSTAPILCFVGPPGTGKTSLGASVARALGRKFVRASLGGIRDEAEIRGHRKTYVAAMPGRILQSMRKAGTANPVFLLDELDKMSSDYHGDPAAALLEVLDPEQNRNFIDNYLEVPYDLSRVLFIATANSRHNIPYPLLDRLEIIEIPGYSDGEKLAIAKKFLLPKALIENALALSNITFSDSAILSVIRNRTMESGVRSLERELNRAVRRLARAAVEKGFGKTGKAPGLLGAPKYRKDALYSEARAGVANGLAWTETGGTMLAIESLVYPGKGELIITGNIGDVMKESARLALSYLRSVKDRYGLGAVDFAGLDYHIHVPEGAIPKDGPSAGITLAVSLLSTLTGKPPRSGVTMTGELTLTGRVLPIGGVKEKTLAAIRGQMNAVILPEGNLEDWKELDPAIRAALAPSFVRDAREAFAAVFEDAAAPAPC